MAGRSPKKPAATRRIRYLDRKRHVIVLVDQTDGLQCFPLLRLGSRVSSASKMLIRSSYRQSDRSPKAASGFPAIWEKEVLGYLLKNYSNKEIATTLNISESTVKFHVSNVISRFGVRRRADLILRFLPESASIH